jgi:hypothetical protein
LQVPSVTISHELEVGLAIVSVVMFVGSLVAVPVFLVKMPDDYFVRPHPPRSLLRRATTTVVGLALVALGIAMLVLPGQGILTILVGLGILELPFKDRVVARLLKNPKVNAAIDKLRHKAGKGSLHLPVPRTAAGLAAS